MRTILANDLEMTEHDQQQRANNRKSKDKDFVLEVDYYGDFTNSYTGLRLYRNSHIPDPENFSPAETAPQYVLLYSPVIRLYRISYIPDSKS